LLGASVFLRHDPAMPIGIGGIPALEQWWFHG
jgi:hypothetical protein